MARPTEVGELFMDKIRDAVGEVNVKASTSPQALKILSDAYKQVCEGLGALGLRENA